MALTLTPISYDTLPGWSQDSFTWLKDVFLASLPATLKSHEKKAPLTLMIGGNLYSFEKSLKALEQGAPLTQKFMETYFQPHKVISHEQGLFTGYYEPELKASLHAQGSYQTPIYGKPEDLFFMADLSLLNPRLKGERLGGRFEGKNLIPYPTRREIYQGALDSRAPVLAWAECPIEAFFMEIQGSGSLLLEEGGRMRVGYGATNGRPYTTLGAVLYEQGVLDKSALTMEGIKKYLRTLDSEALKNSLSHNQSYVFFEKRQGENPLGTLGLELVPERSLAVDPKYIPLGIPLWLECEHPSKKEPLQRFMMAHDTGGAIKGSLRGDFYWGTGHEAGHQAGQMKSPGALYLFLPKERAL